MQRDILTKALLQTESATYERDVLTSVLLSFESEFKGGGSVQAWWEEEDRLERMEEFEVDGAEPKMFDTAVKNFLDMAISGNRNESELMEALLPMYDAISVHLIGPFFGAQAGLVRLGLWSKVPLEAIKLQAEVIERRPGYNDFLMSDWLVSRDYQLIHEMIQRCFDPDEAIATTAMWMIGSTARYTTEFREQLTTYTADPSGFILRDEKDLAVRLLADAELARAKEAVQ